MNTIIYPITPVIEQARTHSRRAPLPLRFLCPNILPDFFMEECGWNGNLCGSDTVFYAPYESGDIIPFQTQEPDLYNADPAVINFGFKSLLTPTNFYIQVALLDGLGNVISDDISDFTSGYWVGYSDKFGSLQTWFVDTSLFPSDLTCFRLRVTYYRIEGGVGVAYKTIYSEEYQLADSCTETSKIEGWYAQTDCNGNFYGQLTNTFGFGNQAFYTSLRVYGTTDFVGEVEDVTENDKGTVIERTVTENYEIRSLRVPPYFIRRLSQAIRGQRVEVDGVEYKNFAFDQKPEGQRMFNLDLTFSKDCEIDNRPCEF